MAEKRSTKKAKKTLNKGKKLPSVKTLSKGRAPYMTYTMNDIIISS